MARGRSERVDVAPRFSALRIVIEIHKTGSFERWLHSLKDERAQGRLQLRLIRLELGNLGDVRSVGAGISELRVDYGPGYRIYFTRRDRNAIILLCGGTKRSQTEDISRARALAHTLRSSGVIEVTRYDTADYLNTPEAVSAFLEAAFEDGDPDLIAHALGTVARARGMIQLAQEAGISKNSLDHALRADRNPDLATLIRVFSALGLRLAVAPTEMTELHPSP
jgi:putative addiction module killer protein/probable addiction module antidote protein